MGNMHYDGTSVEFDDRLLTHLQIVIVQKFRRGDHFLMSWLQEDGDGGRTSLWMSPTVPVHFKFFGSRVPTIDEGWLQRLGASADSSTGLVVANEDGRPIRIRRERPTRGRLRVVS